MLPHANILIVGVLIVVLKSPGGGSTVSHPVLTMSPDYRMYVRGEAVTLMCNASGDYKTKHFYFYKDSKYLQTDNTHMHRIHSLAYDNIGIYACEFWEVSYQSTRSNKITIYLTEIPSAPSIFLTPSLPYNREDSFKMTCSLPNGITITKTLFYKVEPGGSHKLAHNNAIYVINKPDFKIAGKYFCMYTIEIMNRYIDSLESQSILVDIYDFAFSSTSITSTTKPLHATKDFAFSSTSITSTTKPLHTTKGIDTVSTELMTSAVHVGKTQLITTYYPSQPTNITIKENIQENASSWLSVMFIFFTSFILINILILVYLFIKRKTKQTAMSHVSEHIVNITELQHAQALPEAPFIPGNREDLEESHLYSEIDPTTTVLPQSSLISLYATEKKIYLIPPIYKTDLSHHCG
ncbi:uncharacterized protein LOC120940306 isoform X2 [Rana temporaria]|uniref:uncharacterized protein LOC120940306 isoform X2 n=1 Tax=Rana temporaria TaxID=8407 RepID=UPI001AAC5BF9|nr:uncharacterized protein LOC120940306 isoform X2 [Rana temporaria]